jgi:hypothetical protein
MIKKSRVLLLALSLTLSAFSAGCEEVLRHADLLAICAPGERTEGPGPGWLYGAWTHRIAGLGRSATKAEKAKVCAQHGFPYPSN